MLVDISRNIGKPIALAIYLIRRNLKSFLFNKHYNDGSNNNNDSNKTRNFPKITLLIPAHNESASIRKTIISALENSYPNKEIIIIDDHSSDDTYQQAFPYKAKGLIKLVKRTEGKGSKSGAINYEALFATGDILMVMDGDTIIERNVLSEVAKYMSHPGVVATAGNVRILSGDGGITNLLTRSQSYEYLIAFELGRRVRSLMNILVIIPGAFGAFRKETARKIGLYDKDTMTEDFDFTIKLFKTGGQVEFIPNAIAWTYCPNNWKGWIRQRIRWSHGQFTTLLKHQDVMRSRNSTYRFLFILGIYDMFFMDIALLFIRTVSLIWIFLLLISHLLLYLST